MSVDVTLWACAVSGLHEGEKMVILYAHCVLYGAGQNKKCQSKEKRKGMAAANWTTPSLHPVSLWVAHVDVFTIVLLIAPEED